MRTSRFAAVLLFIAAPILAHATVFATLHGVVHDPQHHPIANAQITLEASESAFALHGVSAANGEFRIAQIPIGVYRLDVSAPGFASVSQSIMVASGTNPVLHIPLQIPNSTQSVVVRADANSLSATDSVTPTTLITRQMIDETPGATATTGMEMITDYVPGSYMTHDMLHMRGGHQTSWLIDGVSIPNTKIASNVGPQIDPKDIDSLETQRGSYTADIGDRTYGVFNVLPRNGFERDREAELLLYGGNLYSGEAQLSLGDHSAKTAWYTSFTGSRSNYGLATPISANLPRRHQLWQRIRFAYPQPDRQRSAPPRRAIPSGLLPDSLRPDPNDYEMHIRLLQLLRPARRPDRARLLRHRQLGPHALTQSSILRRALLPLQPGQLRLALPPTSPSPQPGTRTPTTSVAQADAHDDIGPNSFSAGLYSFYQAENDLFGSIVNDGSAPSQPNTHRQRRARRSVEFYFSDHLRLGRYVTLLGGERILHLPRAASTKPPSILASAPLSRSPVCTGSFAASTAISSSPHPSKPSPASCSTTSSSSQRREHLHAAAVRARRRASVRHSDSVERLDPRRRQLQKPRQQLPRSLQRRRIQYVLPHRRRWRTGSRLGDDAALTATRPLRPVSTRLFQPDRRAAWQRHRRLHLQRPQ